MTLFDLGQRFIGHLQELPGNHDNPYIQWAHSLSGLGLDTPDEIAWCSSWVNSLAWLLGLPRSKSAAARSWLKVGTPVLTLLEAQVGNDVVILNRGGSTDPNVPGPGHVGIFAGLQGNDRVLLLAGNQGNAVSIASFPADRVLGIRRIG